MKTATTHSEQGTAQTSRSAPPYEIDLSEEDYLAREVADAKAALSHALADFKNSVATSADLRLWVKHYPWAALGAAAVGGFAVGTAVTPAPGETVTEKLNRLRANGRKAETAAAPQAANAAAAPNPKATFASSLIDLAKLLIESLITAAFRTHGPTGEQAVPPRDRWEAKASGI